MVVNKKALIAIACFLLVSFTAANAADVAKIGIVDFQRFLTTSKAGKTAQEEFKNQGVKMEADLKKAEDAAAETEAAPASSGGAVEDI